MGSIPILATQTPQRKLRGFFVAERHELARKSDDTKKPQRRSRGGLCKAPPQGKSAQRSGADNSLYGKADNSTNRI